MKTNHLALCAVISLGGLLGCSGSSSDNRPSGPTTPAKLGEPCSASQGCEEGLTCASAAGVCVSPGATTDAGTADVDIQPEASIPHDSGTPDGSTQPDSTVPDGSDLDASTSDGTTQPDGDVAPDSSVPDGSDLDASTSDGDAVADSAPQDASTDDADDCDGAGDCGTPTVGVSWRPATAIATSYPAEKLYGVTWTGNQWIAVGGHGVALTSADGLSWSGHDSGTVRRLASVGWDGAQAIAVGDYGVAQTSVDGVNWTDLFSEASSWYLKSVAVGPSKTVLVGGAKYYIGPDYSYPGIAIVGPSSGGWPVYEVTNSQWLLGVTWTGTQFLSVGEAGAVLMSTNGSNWLTRSSNTQSDLYAVASTGSRAVAVGWAGTIVISDDTVNWTVIPTATTNSLEGVVWTGQLFVTVGQDGTIMTSPNGQTWTPRDSGTMNSISAVAFNGNQLVAVGQEHLILVSP